MLRASPRDFRNFHMYLVTISISTPRQSPIFPGIQWKILSDAFYLTLLVRARPVPVGLSNATPSEIHPPVLFYPIQLLPRDYDNDNLRYRRKLG